MTNNDSFWKNFGLMFGAMFEIIVPLLIALWIFFESIKCLAERSQNVGR